jgi:hypothetical protein
VGTKCTQLWSLLTKIYYAVILEKWLQLSSFLGTAPWRLVHTDFPEGISTTILRVVRKGWFGLTWRGRKQVPRKSWQLFAIWDGVVQDDLNLHQHQQQNLKYRKSVCHPVSKTSTNLTEWVLFITWLYKHINKPTPEVDYLCSRKQTSCLSRMTDSKRRCLWNIDYT